MQSSAILLPNSDCQNALQIHETIRQSLDLFSEHGILSDKTSDLAFILRGNDLSSNPRKFRTLPILLLAHKRALLFRKLGVFSLSPALLLRLHGRHGRPYGRDIENTGVDVRGEDAVGGGEGGRGHAGGGGYLGGLALLGSGLVLCGAMAGLRGRVGGGGMGRTG